MFSAVIQSALTAATCISLLSGGARAADLHVPGDHPDIQSAIDASVDGDTIHVAAGTWPGAISFLDHSVTLQGAGADLTIIDGQGAAQTVLVDLSPSTVKLNDLTITGGQIGVAATPFSWTHLLRCTIRDNTGLGATGAIYAIECDFLDNGGTGLSPFRQAGLCTFAGNGGWGAEHVTGESSVSIVGCRFLGNGLGGARLAAADAGSPFETSTQVFRCIFVGDKLQLSAFNPGGSAINLVEFSTFDDATIKLMNGFLSLEYVISRGPAPVLNLSSSGFSAHYSNIEGLISFPSQHNIDTDPLWTNPAAGDYSLQPGSPCINVEDEEPWVDLDGSPWDMGAIPYHPWTDLGGGVAGVAGLASLSGDGPLIAQDELSLSLTSAQPHAPAWLLLGLDELGAPFKGGTLWPVPSVIAGPFPTSDEIAGTWPDGLPAGFSFTTQMWWPDASAVAGWAASNGLRGVQP